MTSSRPTLRRLRDTPVGPAAALFPLRVFLGATFLYAGVQKLSDPGYLTPGSTTYIGTQLHEFARATPGGFLLRALAIPHPGLAGVLAAVVELFVGILVLVGLCTRAAALAGLLLNLLLFLTNSWHTHPYFLGSDIVFVFAWMPVALAGAAGQPAADTWLATRRAPGAPADQGAPGTRPTAGVGGELSRRAALGRGLAAAAGATAAFAGLSVLIRSLRPAPHVTQVAQLGSGSGASASGTPNASAATAPQAATPTPTGPPQAGPSSAPNSGPLPAGSVRLGPSSRLPAGQAAVYSDPVDHTPDILIRQTNGTLTALSAVCTHAGCQCVYQASAQGGELVCPCHGSRFDAISGDVIQGPAVRPLPLREVVDRGGSLYAVPGRS